jgi:hypothetical protein
MASMPSGMVEACASKASGHEWCGFAHLERCP